MVAAPVRTRHLHQFEMLELARARDVGAAAQILKSTFAVKANILGAGDAGDDLRLVMLPNAFEIRDCFVAWQHTTNYRLVLGCKSGHAFFDGFQVFWREGTLVGKVIEKAVFNHGANRDLGIRKKLFDCIGKQVRRRVTNYVQSFGILCRHDRKRTILADQITGIDHLVAHFTRQGCLGEA